MSLRPSGRATASRREQCQNTLVPMKVTAEGMSHLLSRAQPMKAPFPTDVSDRGSVIEARLIHAPGTVRYSG